MILTQKKMNRTDRLKLLDLIINQGDLEALKSLTRPIYPSVLIFEQQGEGLFFNRRLNSTLPAKYKDKVLTDAEANTMLSENGNLTIFLLPDNFRD